MTFTDQLIAAEKKRRSRRKAIRKVVVGVVSSVIEAFLGGWLLMLAVGIAHTYWLPALPTVGYWTSVVLVVLLRGVFSRPTTHTSGARNG